MTISDEENFQRVFKDLGFVLGFVAQLYIERKLVDTFQARHTS